MLEVIAGCIIEMFLKIYFDEIVGIIIDKIVLAVLKFFCFRPNFAD